MKPHKLAWMFLLVFAVTACAEDGTDGPPAAPTGVTATVDSLNSTINVTWKPVPDATEYSIYMASQSGVTKLNYIDLPGNMFHPDLVASFPHPSGLVPDTTYYFIVTALNGVGESAESCEVNARISAATGGEACGQ